MLKKSFAKICVFSQFLQTQQTTSSTVLNAFYWRCTHKLLFVFYLSSFLFLSLHVGHEATIILMICFYALFSCIFLFPYLCIDIFHLNCFLETIVLYIYDTFLFLIFHIYLSICIYISICLYIDFGFSYI